MITVLTITYQRHHLLEEALESYLQQDFSVASEMLIVNDHPGVKYVFDHPRVRIINCDTRFPTLGEKLTFGFEKAKFKHIYRLDDDDILTPWAIKDSALDIKDNPGYLLYRSDGHYFFNNNKYDTIVSSVNNGNIFDKKYYLKEGIPSTSEGEDLKMVTEMGAKTFTSMRERKTMIYRWGMGTYHVSVMYNRPDGVESGIDQLLSATKANELGEIRLNPRFHNDYYGQLPH
jgi:glycosyltransferase involved in cell wall biosynthesis